MPRPGESLGKYRLVRRIGLGGMAEVWLAKVSGPGGFTKKLVLKTVLEHQAQNADFIAQFLDEARLAALLTHPNIVQIFELGEQGGTYFIAMEYVKGHDLQDVRKQCAEAGRPFPIPYLARIACGVCEGLHYAHELPDEAGRPLNLVHRDVSPENVLISYDGAIKIVDFGIAKASISQVTTRAGLFKGKLHYATPERLLGQPIDRRDDLYGLGAVLYETATGRPPIDGKSEGEMVRRILDGDFPPLRELAPEAPEEFERIVQKCMAWGPDDRYPTARDLQRDLERFIAASGEPATSFEIAEFMQELFIDDLDNTSEQLAVDLEAVTSDREALAAFDPDDRRALSDAEDEALEGLGLELDGASVEEEGYDDPTVETRGLAAPPTVRDPAPPRSLVPPTKPAADEEPEASPASASALEPSRASAASYGVEEPPVAPRRRLGLIAGGVAALAVVGAIVGLSIWAPWGASGGGGPADPGRVDAALVARADGGAAAARDAARALEDGSPARAEAGPAATDGGATVPAGDGAPPYPEEDGGDEDDEAGPEDPLEIAGPSGVLSLRGPPGCSARFGEVRLGALPVERPLPVGSQEIQIRCPFGVRRVVPVEIRAGETTEESVRLRTGSLLLLVRPWAEVFIDGRRRGITPLGAIELPEGSHSVRLVNNEIRARRTERVRIRPGERTTLRVRLD